MHYCTASEAETYALSIDSAGHFSHAGTGHPLNTPDAGWIFVLRDGAFYAAEKRTTSPRFHHSSFFGGACVEVAGMLVAKQGRVTRLFPHSGHYRPGDQHIEFLLRFLNQANVDLAAVEVDVQRTMKVARCPATREERDAGGEASAMMKKSARPHLLRADVILGFLELKSATAPLFDELTSRPPALRSPRTKHSPDSPCRVRRQQRDPCRGAESLEENGLGAMLMKEMKGSDSEAEGEFSGAAPLSVSPLSPLSELRLDGLDLARTPERRSRKDASPVPRDP